MQFEHRFLSLKRSHFLCPSAGCLRYVSCSSIACGSSFVYAHLPSRHSLLKVGTGHGNTIAGHVYAVNEKFCEDNSGPVSFFVCYEGLDRFPHSRLSVTRWILRWIDKSYVSVCKRVLRRQSCTEYIKFVRWSLRRVGFHALLWPSGFLTEMPDALLVTWQDEIYVKFVGDIFTTSSRKRIGSASEAIDAAKGSSTGRCTDDGNDSAECAIWTPLNSAH